MTVMATDAYLERLLHRHFAGYKWPRRGQNNGVQTEILQHEQVVEFVRAVEVYKRINRRPFPTNGELFLVLAALGYRKVVM